MDNQRATALVLRLAHFHPEHGQGLYAKLGFGNKPVDAGMTLKL